MAQKGQKLPLKAPTSTVLLYFVPMYMIRGHLDPYWPKNTGKWALNWSKTNSTYGGPLNGRVFRDMIITIFSHLFKHRRSDFYPKIYCQEISLALYRGGLIHFWETTLWFPKYELSKKAPTPRSWDLSSRHLETIWWWDPLKKSGWHFFSIDTPYEETCAPSHLSSSLIFFVVLLSEGELMRIQ